MSKQPCALPLLVSFECIRVSVTTALTYDVTAALHWAGLVLGLVTFCRGTSSNLPPRLKQPSTLHGAVKSVSAFRLSNYNKWRWWVLMIAAYRWTQSQSKLAWSEGLRPLGAVLHSSNERGELSQWLPYWQHHRQYPAIQYYYTVWHNKECMYVCISHLLIHLSAHLCHHHHSYHPSLFHSRLKTYLFNKSFPP